MKTTILLIPLFLTGTVAVRAQSVGPATINAVGNTAIISDNEFDWSVGEMTMVSTFTNPAIIVTQGVLQPADVDKTGVAVSTLTHRLRVFPNPAVSIVNVEYTSETSGLLSYRLLDANGKIISTHAVKIAPGKITEQVNVSGLAAANYLLKVAVTPNNAATENASFKIQKLQ